MSQTTELSPLIQTKLHRSRVADELIERPRLLAYLYERTDRTFTLVSAPAGYGKTTLLAQWLDQAPYQAAWLSLNENDNNLIGFLSYFVAAIQTLFPTGCPTTQSLLTVAQTPSLDYLTTTLINELADLTEEFLLVLDDYHLITHQEIQKLISALMRHAPFPLHLVIASLQRSALSWEVPLEMGSSLATMIGEPQDGILVHGTTTGDEVVPAEIALADDTPHPLKPQPVVPPFHTNTFDHYIARLMIPLYQAGVRRQWESHTAPV